MSDTVARLLPNGLLDVIDTARPGRREQVDVAPGELKSQRVRRRWATYALEKAGWWAHGRWWTEDDADVRRVAPLDRVMGAVR